jgi:argininosuccinate lyase
VLPDPRFAEDPPVLDAERVRELPAPHLRRLLYGDTADSEIDRYLLSITEIDRAHIVGLVEAGLMRQAVGAALLREIARLRGTNFDGLRGRHAPRGLYMLYESHLIERLGQATGGALQLGRSRNDLNATSIRLALRRPYLRLTRRVLALLAVLIRRARAYADVTMPLYTHYQRAVPITYGHYLAGVTTSIQRDAAAILAAASELDTSPLGAGAGGGTALPIDTHRTAELLGFSRNADNSIDAVASRDFVLHLIAAAAILGVTISRAATDLLLWTTAEFGMLTLPDSLVGASSMMPQKRNVFMLENVQGRTATAIGAWVAAVASMRSTPFTNSIAVGTEGTRHVWTALESAGDSVDLLRAVVAGARPSREVMLSHAVRGMVVATELANDMVRAFGIDFRSAHRIVGGMVRAAEERNVKLESTVAEWVSERGSARRLVAADPTDAAARANAGGGPGRESLESSLRALRARWSEFARARDGQRRSWDQARIALDRATDEISHTSGDAIHGGVQ